MNINPVTISGALILLVWRPAAVPRFLKATSNRRTPDRDRSHTLWGNYPPKIAESGQASQRNGESFKAGLRFLNILLFMMVLSVIKLRRIIMFDIKIHQKYLPPVRFIPLGQGNRLKQYVL